MFTPLVLHTVDDIITKEPTALAQELGILLSSAVIDKSQAAVLLQPAALLSAALCKGIDEAKREAAAYHSALTATAPSPVPTTPGSVATTPRKPTPSIPSFSFGLSRAEAVAQGEEVVEGLEVTALLRPTPSTTSAATAAPSLTLMADAQVNSSMKRLHLYAVKDSSSAEWDCQWSEEFVKGAINPMVCAANGPIAAASR